MIRVSALNRKLLRDLWHLRGQALAIALVVASGVAAFVMAMSAHGALSETQAAFYRAQGFAQVFLGLKRAPERLARELEGWPEVAAVETRVAALATLDLPGFPESISARLLSLPERGRPRLNRPYVTRGRLPERDRHEALVSEAFAEAHGLKPGDRFHVLVNGRRLALAVAGIALSPEFIYQVKPGELFPDYSRYAILWLPERLLAAAYDMKGAFNELALVPAPGVSEARLIARLDRRFADHGGLGAYGRDQQFSHRYLRDELRHVGIMAAFLPSIFLGVAAFLLHLVSQRLVTEQREQIAVLKAFGYRDAVVARHYLLLISLVVAAGLVLGLWGGHALGQAMAGVYRAFFRFPYLHFHLSPSVLLIAVIAGSAAAFLGTSRALRQIMTLAPAEAMRPEAPPRYRVSLVERAGLRRHLGQPVRMLLRHLLRRPRRLLASVLAMALAVAILIVSGFQHASIARIVEIQFGRAETAELAVVFREALGGRALKELAALPGVRRAEGYRAVPVELVHGQRRYRTQLLGLSPGAQLRRLLDAGLNPVTPPEGGLLLTDHLAGLLGLAPGDAVEVRVLEGARPVREARVGGLVSEYLGVGAYQTLSGLGYWLREPGRYSGAYLAVDAEALPALQARLKGLPGVVSVVNRRAAIASFHATMAETIRIFSAFITALAATLAFGVVYNAARIAYAEHRREFASLRVLGYRQRELAVILLGEIGLTTALALLPGCFLGTGLAWLIGQSLASDLFRIPLVVTRQTYTLASLTVVLAAGLSALALWRSLRRLDPVSALKTVE